MYSPINYLENKPSLIPTIHQIHCIKYSSIYITGSNLLTFSNYLGYDPEFSATNSALAQGINTGMVPQYKSFLIGIRLGLKSSNNIV